MGFFVIECGIPFHHRSMLYHRSLVFVCLCMWLNAMSFRRLNVLHNFFYITMSAIFF